MDPYRLPRHIVPTRYDLRLEPDLTAKTFEGDLTISLRVLHPASEIVLNAAELEISRGEVEIEDESGVLQQANRVELEEETERCRLTFPDPITPGTWHLRLRFKGRLTTKDGKSKLEGFYLSTYEDPSGVSRPMASTQFESTAARQAFPCWDDPTFKAVFALTRIDGRAVVVAVRWEIANWVAEGDRGVPEGQEVGVEMTQPTITMGDVVDRLFDLFAVFGKHAQKPGLARLRHEPSKRCVVRR